MRGKATTMATVTRSRSKLPAPKFLASLPPLPVIVRATDGTEHTVYIPDPRSAFASAFEADSDGATCHLPPAKHAVVIVEKPEDWQPASSLDVPPGAEVHYESTRVKARSLAHGFNNREMEEPKGWWAVEVESLPTPEQDNESTAHRESCNCHRTSKVQ